MSVSHPDPAGRERRVVPPALGGGTILGPKVETPTDAEVRAWARACYGAEACWAWLEPAASALDPYRMPNIVHLRLYYDAQMRPFMPAGEVSTLKPLEGLSPPKITEGAAGGDAR